MPTTTKHAGKAGVQSVDVVFTHPDKPYWPEDGLTKGDMLAYYEAMSPVMLPYFKDRPVTLRMYPNGIHGVSHYRRDRPPNSPPWLRSVSYLPETGDEKVPLILVDDRNGLLWLANRGAIEMHLWTSQVGDLEHPDQVAFDLDPGDKTAFKDVLSVALVLRDLLESRGLESYPKTSGGRGVHVYVPLKPQYTFEQVRTWAKSVAQQLAQAQPERVAVAHGGTHEGTRVTFDYAQNSIGRNTAAPYTLRGLPGAPVSTPLAWEEVQRGKVEPADFTLTTVPERMKDVGDLFKPVLKVRQKLPTL
jgi:bifunctional non-homologous end joining protein LigD